MLESAVRLIQQQQQQQQHHHQQQQQKQQQQQQQLQQKQQQLRPIQICLSQPHRSDSRPSTSIRSRDFVDETVIIISTVTLSLLEISGCIDLECCPCVQVCVRVARRAVRPVHTLPRVQARLLQRLTLAVCLRPQLGRHPLRQRYAPNVRSIVTCCVFASVQFTSVQFSSRLYLCAREGPYALHPVSQ